MEKDNSSHFKYHLDTSVVAKFPPGLFQKGMAHVLAHPDEQFKMQITADRVFLRRYKSPVAGITPKDSVNGRLITWTYAHHLKSDKDL